MIPDAALILRTFLPVAAPLGIVLLVWCMGREVTRKVGEETETQD